MVTSVGRESAERKGIELALLLRPRKPKLEVVARDSSVSTALAGVRGGGLNEDAPEDIVLVRLRLDIVCRVDGLVFSLSVDSTPKSFAWPCVLRVSESAVDGRFVLPMPKRPPRLRDVFERG